MFKDDYQAAFSKVTASGETYRRVLNMANTDNSKKTRRGAGVVGKVLIAAAMISLLTVTASAAELGWFHNFFQKQGDTPLTPEQVEFIDANEQKINEAQTQNGYTLEVKSVIADGSMAYITIGITGPEDAVLNKTVIEGYDPAAPSIMAGNWMTASIIRMPDGTDLVGGMSMWSEEDNDGKDNTQNLIMTMTPEATESGKPAIAPGSTWTIHIEDLVGIYSNEAYRKELMEKYNTENIMLTEEEGKLLNPEIVLAEGTWDFDITFDGDIRKVELIDQPVTTTACMGGEVTENGDYREIMKEVQINSFTLSALSAAITVDEVDAPDFTNGFSRFVYVVLKDGSHVQLMPKVATPGRQELAAQRPIPLDQVDHVLLADGTELPMP